VANQDAKTREKAAEDFVANLDTVNDAQTAFFKALTERDASGIDKALAALDAAPRVDEETDALRGDLKSLLARAKDYAEGAGGPPGRKEARARQEKGEMIFQDFGAWHRRYENWTTNESQRTGVKLVQDDSPKQDSTKQDSTNGK
jgi:hypothetical protein